MRIIQIRQICETFPHVCSQLNSNKVVYRDLKPENVMLDQEAVKSIHSVWLVLSWLFQVDAISWITTYTLQYIHISYIVSSLSSPWFVQSWFVLAALNDIKAEHVNTSIHVQHISTKVRSSFRRQGYVKIIDFGVGHPGPPGTAICIADNLSVPVFHQHTSI